MTGEQCKEARRLLKWTQNQLGQLVGLNGTVIGSFERIGRLPRARSGLSWNDELRTALEAAGVQFLDKNGGGLGVRLRKTGP